MFIRMITCLSIILLGCTGIAAAATWVPSPSSVPGSLGDIETGDACCAWVKVSGDHMLFFDIWSGAWTELTLPETHTLVATEAAGNLVLAVFEDMAVAFDGPDATAHVLPLNGALLETQISRPSFGCGDVLAVVCTDAEFAVFDSNADTWRVLEYEFPADYSYHAGTVWRDDYVVSELARTSNTGSKNLVYSRRTGTFLEELDGVLNIRSRYLDHGFVGELGAWPNQRLKGYSAFTGKMTQGAVSVDGGLGSSLVSRDRREIRHLGGGCELYSTEPYETVVLLYVYDTITATWHQESYSFDSRDFAATQTMTFGGRFGTHFIRNDDDYSNHIRIFTGHDHSWGSDSPGIYGTSFSLIHGGSVVAYGQSLWPGSSFYWCRSDQNAAGQYTSSSRDNLCCGGAGEQWISFGQYSIGDPLMDLFFYHGPSNTMQQVETWQSTQFIGHKGVNVHSLITYGDNVHLNFFSGHLGTVAQRTMPYGSQPGSLFNDNMVLAFHNGVGDYLFDARTGLVQSRGVDFSSTSLGDEVVLGFDPATFTAHGYSAVTGNWTTQAIGEAGYGYAGDNVAVFQNQNGSSQWGFNALDDSWTPLSVTGGLPFSVPGGRTIIARSSDRVWAFWLLDGTSGVEDDLRQETELAHALSQVFCSPNPFNGRTVVRFDLPLRAHVKVQVFDLRGARVATLLEEASQPGRITAIWDTEHVASGSYVVRLEADGVAVTKKVTLLK